MCASSSSSGSFFYLFIYYYYSLSFFTTPKLFEGFVLLGVTAGGSRILGGTDTAVETVFIVSALVGSLGNRHGQAVPGRGRECHHSRYHGRRLHQLFLPGK